MSDGGSFQSKMAILVRSIPPLTQDLLTLGSRPMSGTLGLILMRLLRLFIGCSLFLLLASLVLAQWQRTVFSGKGQFTDVPTPHPLSYFTADPFLRDDGGDFCEVCTPPDKERYVITSEVQRLGTLAGFPLSEVLYRISSREKGEPAEIKWKSILVQTGDDSYREIYHLQASGGGPSTLTPAKIVKVGDEEVLATNDPDGGNGGGCWDAYWWFDSSGPHQLDFSKVRAAITKQVASGAFFWTTCWAMNLEQQEIKSVVQKGDARCHACDMLGEVTAHFRLHGAVAEPISVEFVADPPVAH